MGGRPRSAELWLPDPLEKFRPVAPARAPMRIEAAG
jgi:hypothetical protein